MPRTPQQAPAQEEQRLRPRPRDVAALSDVEAELRGSERLGLDDLRIRWRNRWGRRAPARLSASLLFRVMAYRIQAEAFGDLERKTVRMLESLGAGRDSRTGPAAAADEVAEETVVDSECRRADRSKAPAMPIDQGLVLKPGTLLTREWQGRIERVMAMEQGFTWNGKSYASLSAVAFAITGTKWNGHRFFGVRRCDRTRATEREGAMANHTDHSAKSAPTKGRTVGSRATPQSAPGHPQLSAGADR